ncbi:MYXO-CTERM domain-containing protein [Catenulispora sp. GP43]|uniref:hypothetical protein n=1 Tax=Catenulispora sp. GP43 TaxID=3156263 RepID=UPI0035128223
MRSIKTTVTAAALLTAGMVIAAPAASAATATHDDHDRGTCQSAIADAQKARHDYERAVDDLKNQDADGDHHGTAGEQSADGDQHGTAGEQSADGDQHGTADDPSADGDHHGTADDQKVSDLMIEAKSAVWEAVRACKDMDHRHMRRHPHGAMHTGVGSTSQGANGGEMAAGMGMLGAAGAGALALRRRRAGSES